MIGYRPLHKGLIEVKSAFPKESRFHCCKQDTLFPNLNIANKLHGLPLGVHAVG